MIYQLADGVIKTATSSYGNPPGSGFGMHVGVATWLLIDGVWYQWDGSTPHAALVEAKCLTIAEFKEYFADRLT